MLLLFASMASFTLSKGDCERERAKTWDPHWLSREWTFCPHGWWGSPSNRGEHCCSCKLYKFIIPAFPVKENQTVHTFNYVLIYLLHGGIIYNTHITCGTSCHKTLSLNLFWRFSHYKQNPKILRLFSFIWNCKVHVFRGEKFNHTSNEPINFWLYFPSW